ncbi:MAG TPA: 2Fe-2S iron-sulfur cluster-binding protein [Dehalococcoidia bacterium]|jgi:fumarate reductase iron-sulfur subunit
MKRTRSDRNVTVHIERFNPNTDVEPHWEVFEVPYTQRHSVLTLLHYIYEQYDPALGYRNYTCGRGICDSCRVNLGGKVRKGCATPIKEGEEIYLRPCSKFVIKDLATVLPGGPAEPAVLEDWRQQSQAADPQY